MCRGEAKKMLKILFVSSEVAPYIKTGGLADVVGSLPQALNKLGHDTRVVLPEYKQIAYKYIKKLEHIISFNTKLAWRKEYVGINQIKNAEVKTYFLDNKYFFWRDNLYKNNDRALQFAFFCRAVLDMLPRINFKPDIIHCHDWQTGPLSLFLKSEYKNKEFYKNIKTVFTIHNLRYQGKFSFEILDDILAVDKKYWYKGLIKNNNLINYMKIGIMTADKITTVSDTYAEEIKTSHFGEGLDYALKFRENDLSGIINGIDYNNFNPEFDKKIYVNYSHERIRGKLENKLRLQQKLKLAMREKTPIIGFISRLCRQKGIDLLLKVIKNILQEDIQFILLGTGDPTYEYALKQISKLHPDKTSINLKYDSNLAHKIYAGSDLFLMPSEYEPCGLSQLISLRYGTIPIVRETGGLNDTIEPYSEYNNSGNGFTFTHYNAHDMLYTIKRAITFYHKPEIWSNLVQKAMKADFSWTKSAEKYSNLYKII
ncbi:MAG: glycogen synthase GlgA [Halothermotrichaceae bacterium]